MYLNELAKNQPVQINYKHTNIIGFYDVIRRALLVCRWFGLLPLSGLSNSDSQNVRFSWKTPYTLLFLFIIILHCVVLASIVIDIFRTDLTLASAGMLTLSMTILLETLFLIPISKNWNKMLTAIEEIEKSLPPLRRKTVVYINMVMILMAASATVEHILYQIFEYKLTSTCNKQPGNSGLYLQSFIFNNFNLKSTFPAFQNLMAVFLLTVVLGSTFIWTFSDVLVINISMYLVSRLHDFNVVLNQKEKELLKKTESSPDLPWSDLQQYYTRLMKLVSVLDENINPIVFLSFVNMLIIGKQIYLLLTAQMRQSLQGSCKDESLETFTIIYYSYSSTFMLAKVTLVSAAASRVYTLSRKPLDSLYTIPTFAYDQTFQRFVDQVFHSNVSLSGLRCFYVTRRTLLSVLASFLTYELMLLQNK